MIAAANPLRDPVSDADYISAVLHAITEPIVLVGHSYGGSVITNAATGNPSVRTLAYIAGFAPDTGETAADILDKFPGRTLGPAPEQIPLGGGGVEVRVRQDLFPQQFANDVPLPDVRLMAVAQRPVSTTILTSRPARRGGDPSPPTSSSPLATRTSHPPRNARAHGTTVTVPTRHTLYSYRSPTSPPGSSNGPRTKPPDTRMTRRRGPTNPAPPANARKPDVPARPRRR